MGQVFAQDAADLASVPAAEQTSPSARTGSNGKVCHYEVVTGSRMKKRVCHTPEQWEARERAARDLVREIDGKSLPYTDDRGG
ncbi:hypothetical protein [Luteimonas suaedae]|uniref:hypothetical protein n=1 Tax=Luteimonas suaedae TaxID=2605430 RepID=UPI0011ED7AFB|nr:hypothetical protein [Luteimonas suaedae]